MRIPSILGSCILATSVHAGLAAEQHALPLAPANVHWGYYDATIEPVLRIGSGDTVRVETLVARGLERLRMAGAREDEISDAMRQVEETVTERMGSHPLTGPIYVEGAEPGDVLEVQILEIDLMQDVGVGAFLPHGGTLPEDFPYGALELIRLDRETRTAELGSGITIPLRPFFGSIGVAPPRLSGRISSNPPGAHAGNLDNKELVAGTTLFLPVHVAGGLLSIGDGHAAQGDGEVSGTAIETSLSGTVKIVLHKDLGIQWPRAETPTHYLSMGLHPDLDEAAKLATREMIDFLVAEKGLSPRDAYILCSLAVDLRVTQLVDGTKGIHALLPKAVFE